MKKKKSQTKPRINPSRNAGHGAYIEEIEVTITIINGKNTSFPPGLSALQSKKIKEPMYL